MYAGVPALCGAGRWCGLVPGCLRTSQQFLEPGGPGIGGQDHGQAGGGQDSGHRQVTRPSLPLKNFVPVIEELGSKSSSHCSGGSYVFGPLGSGSVIYVYGSGSTRKIIK